MHDLLRALPPQDKKKWPNFLDELLYCYNITPHSRTGFTSFKLMFGREARICMDMFVEDSDEENNENWTSMHQRRLHYAYELVKQKLNSAADK